jgi:hypothetical protein
LLRKRIMLPDGSPTYVATYANSTGADHYVRVGASPVVLQLMIAGRDGMTTRDTAAFYEVSAGDDRIGLVRVFYGTATLNPAPADAGYANRNLALTEQIEVYGGPSFSFGVQIGTSMYDMDWDGDVDAEDLEQVAQQLHGPEQPTSTHWHGPDWERDDDCDLADFAHCQQLATGAL